MSFSDQFQDLSKPVEPQGPSLNQHNLHEKPAIVLPLMQVAACSSSENRFLMYTPRDYHYTVSSAPSQAVMPTQTPSNSVKTPVPRIFRDEYRSELAPREFWYQGTQGGNDNSDVLVEEERMVVIEDHGDETEDDIPILGSQPEAISQPQLEPMNIEAILSAILGKQKKSHGSKDSFADMLPARALAMNDITNPAAVNSLINYLDSQARTTRNGRKQRVEISDSDDKAKLVKLCHEHFELYRSGKMKFYDLMRVKYWIATSGKLDVNVKGYMERWEKKRRGENEADKIASGVARNYGEWEIALDLWISAIDDYEKEKNVQKAVKDKDAIAATQEKAQLEAVREGMVKSFAGKKRMRVSDGDTIDNEDALAVLVETDEELENEEIPERKVINSSKRVRSERFMKDIKEGDAEMMKFLQESDSKKMDRWEALLQPVVSGLGGGSNDLKDRIEQVESQNASTLEKLNKQEEQMAKQGEKLDTILDLVLQMRQEMKN